MKRFCPGCTQRKLQMNAAPCEICGRVNLVEAPIRREQMHPFARMLRALLAPLGRFFHLLTALFCVFALWSMALHGILPFFGIVSLGLFSSGSLAISIWIIRLATRVAVYVFTPATRQARRPGARTFLILPVCLAVLLLLKRFDVPLRFAFLLSRPSLETSAATTLMPGALRVRAGFYRIKKREVAGPNVRLEVTNDEFLWSGTKAGFAKCPNGCQTANFSPAYMRSDPPRYLQLSKGWFWWEESGSDD